MNFERLLRVVRERWLAIVVCVAVGLLAGVLAATLSPRKYSSTVTMYISATSTPNTTAAYQGGLLSEQRVASYVQLLTGGRIADEVTRQLGLPGPASVLQSKITASSLPNSVILDATVTDDNPVAAAREVNAVGAEFVDLIGQLERPEDPNQPPTVIARIVENGTPPASYVSPRPFADVIGGLLAGLVLGLFVTIVSDLRDVAVKSDSDVEEASAKPILAKVPASKSLAAIEDESPGNFEFEAYRRLRTNLQLTSFDRKDSRVLVVTSSVAEEGKTTTTFMLGRSLSEAGHRVLLIEADLRRPSLARKLGLDAPLGLTSLLTGRSTMRDSIWRTKFANLYLLAAGAKPPNPSELLGTEVMVDIVEKARGQFDYILIDTPPLLPVTDGLVVSGLSDGVLVVVKYGETARQQLSSSVGQVESASSRVIGVVLNMLPRSALQASYGGESYYYSSAEGEKANDEPPTPPSSNTDGERPKPSPVTRLT